MKKNQETHERWEPAQYDFIKGAASAAGITVSQFIRDSSLKGKILVVGTRNQSALDNLINLLANLVNQAKMIGSNVNQIARTINIDRQNGSVSDYPEIKEHLKNLDFDSYYIADAVSDLLEALQNVDITKVLFKVDTIDYDVKDKTYIQTYNDLQRIRNKINDNNQPLEDHQIYMQNHPVMPQAEKKENDGEQGQDEKDSGKNWIDNFKMPDWSK